MSAHDDFEQFIPEELRAQWRASLPKPKQPLIAKPKPTPKEAVAYPPEPFAERLVAAHATWAGAGSPESGAEADRLVEALVDSYLISEDDSPFERSVIEFADSIGHLPILEAATEAFNNTIQTETTKDQYRADAFQMFDGFTQPILDAVGESFDAPFLQAVRDGEIEPDALKRELALRIETAREIKTQDTKRADLESLNEELLRHGPTFDEKAQAQYAAELRRHTEQETQLKRENIHSRAAIRAGDAPSAGEREREQIEADFRAIGAFGPDPEMQALKDKAAAEAAEAYEAQHPDT